MQYSDVAGHREIQEAIGKLCSQFDDDLNQFPLASFFLLDASVSKRLGHGVDVFAAVENMFDTRVQIAKTPTVNLGPPIFARAGVKFHWE